MAGPHPWVTYYTNKIKWLKLNTCCTFSPHTDFLGKLTFRTLFTIYSISVSNVISPRSNFVSRDLTLYSIPISFLSDCPTNTCSLGRRELCYFFKQSACTALGRCRQNVVASINRTFPLSSPRRGCPKVLEFWMVPMGFLACTLDPPFSPPTTKMEISSYFWCHMCHLT